MDISGIPVNVLLKTSMLFPFSSFMEWAFPLSLVFCDFVMLLFYLEYIKYK